VKTFKVPTAWTDQLVSLEFQGAYRYAMVFEESLRMPFLLSYPRKVAAGKRFDGIVTNVDMAQTILDAAGVEHHPRMQGRSFWPDLIERQSLPPVEWLSARSAFDWSPGPACRGEMVSTNAELLRL
jgi:arylsulfatase A-like enzyme